MDPWEQQKVSNRSRRLTIFDERRPGEYEAFLARQRDVFSEHLLQSCLSVRRLEGVIPSVPDAERAILAFGAPAAFDKYSQMQRNLVRQIAIDIAEIDPVSVLAPMMVDAYSSRRDSKFEFYDENRDFELEMVGGIIASNGSVDRKRRAANAAEITKIYQNARNLRFAAYVADQARDISEMREDGSDFERMRTSINMRTSWLTIRGSAYGIHSEAVASELYARYNPWLRRNIGFDLDDLYRILEAFRKRWSTEVPRAFRESMIVSGLMSRAGRLRKRTTRRTDRYRRELVDRIARAVSFRLEDLEGVDSIVLGRVLEVLAIAPGSHPGWGADAFAQSPLLDRPFFVDGARALLVLPGRVGTEGTILLEPVLKAHFGSDYSRHRAKTVDDEARKIIAGLLPGCSSYGSMFYSKTAQGRSNDFEVDGIVLYEDIAIVIEGKGGYLGVPSRRGDEKRLKNELKDIIGKAYRQASRATAALQAGQEFRSKSGRERFRVSAGTIRKTYILIPTLQPLEGFEVGAKILQSLGVVPPSADFWCVSVPVLKLASEVLAGPAELVAYFDFREAVLSCENLMIPDEVELLGVFLWGTDMGEMREKTLEAGKFEGKRGIGYLGGMQEDFDDYYRYITNQGPPAIKPYKRMTEIARSYVRRLEAERPDGWLEMTSACLRLPYSGMVWVDAEKSALIDGCKGGGSTHLARNYLIMVFDEKTPVREVLGMPEFRSTVKEAEVAWTLEVVGDDLRLIYCASNQRKWFSST
ncbi:hypothetical protein [Candidatus Protofrankia californiensis]|uniref:hypothetical protein n=1 Tax=Candidatus Protofrankia californiensis TaxID=1839754 RepID=UPI001041075D|nr:hypothetical protein [Candidatus Protofrankia californiensis]